MGDAFKVLETQAYDGEEKREFLRLPYEHALKFSVCRKGLLKELQIGTTKNISQNGMLFKAKNSPEASAIILIDTDLKTLANCIEVEDALVELNGRILGKVVRIEPDVSGGFEIAVQFVRVGEETDREVTRAMEAASHFTG